jgi:hypothetical protein
MVEAVYPSCSVCGKEMKSFDIVDPETGNTVSEEICCEDEWKESHDSLKA